ncbi:hypothetical protein PILCRDRAFT_91510 [Piloderma croceum F 1598]|uniref:Uncharacterized protein n=1 Tax=Piloderma croceum (strain F 1598) TaxID=765440 RepID=A0A0C3FAI5_PILCF|nr:hypothetical protein PILCRDRAFT_91510 [Piloderma croceum F 1598]
MSYSAFACALSPLSAAIGAVSTSKEDEDVRRIGRHTTLQAASSVDELLAMIPQDYRHILCEPLLGVANTVTKLCLARATLSRWQSHHAAGTFLPHIRVKAPEVQLLKDFGEDNEGATHRSNLEKAHKAYLVTLLDNSIRAKSDDVMFLEKALDAQRLFDEIAPAVKTRALDILVKSKLPVFTQSETGELSLSGWKENSIAADLGQTILSDIPVYCFRVVSIVEARDHAATTKVKAKKQLHQAADAEMADATKPGPSIQSMIDKAGPRKKI